MLTKPPLAPSKDALRVLRQLAFAGSTLATVGVVTVNYNVYRQIRLTEQLLETKRQIKALSNGNRDVFMARVIEAAESGQDFSLRAMREQRIRERRPQSSGTTFAEGQGSVKQESDSARKLHDDARSDIRRQRTAQKSGKQPRKCHLLLRDGHAGDLAASHILRVRGPSFLERGNWLSLKPRQWWHGMTCLLDIEKKP